MDVQLLSTQRIYTRTCTRHFAVPRTPLGSPSSWIHTFEFLHPQHLCSCILQVCLFGWRPETLKIFYVTEFFRCFGRAWKWGCPPIHGNLSRKCDDQWILRSPMFRQPDYGESRRSTILEPQMTGVMLSLQHIQHSNTFFIKKKG